MQESPVKSKKSFRDSRNLNNITMKLRKDENNTVIEEPGAESGAVSVIRHFKNDQSQSSLINTTVGKNKEGRGSVNTRLSPSHSRLVLNQSAPQNQDQIEKPVIDHEMTDR